MSETSHTAMEHQQRTGRRNWRHILLRYAGAVASTVVALLISMVVPDSHASPVFLPFLATAAAMAWIGELAVGLFTVVLSVFEIVYFIVPPTHTWRVAEEGDVVHLAYYAAAGVAAVVLLSWLRRAERRARHLLENQRVLRHEAEEREQQLAAVLAALPVGVFISTADGKLLQTNPAVESIWGKPVPLLAPDRYHEYKGWFIKDGRRLQAEDWALARALRTGSSVPAEEVEIERFDGAHRVILNSAHPIRGASGDVIGGVAVNVDITEMKEAEQSLRKSEERYRSLVEMSPDAILVHRAGQVQYLNPAAVRMLGADRPEQLVGKSVYELIHPDCERLIRERIERLQNGQSVPLIEQKIVRLDGRAVDVAVTSSQFSDQNGPAIQVILHDITERKREEEHRLRLHRTLAALNSSNEVLLRATTETALLDRICGIIVEDCGYAMAWIGLAENDVEKSVRVVAHAGQDEGYIKSLRLSWADNEWGRGPTGTAIRTGQPIVCPDMLHDPRFAPWREAALQRSYASTLSVPLLAEGKAFGAIAVYTREPNLFSEPEIGLLAQLASDLAYGIASLRLRAARDQAEVRLQESEEKFRTLVEHAVDAVFVHDSEGRFVDVNQCACTSLGYSREELLSMSVSEVTEGLDLAAEQKKWFETKPGMSFTSPVNQKRKDGSTFPVEARVGSFHFRGRRLYLALARDVSERRQAQEALIRAEKLASAGRMAATVAHEINNPLAAVMNTVFIARSSAESPEKVREALDVADEELRRIAHITQQTLGFYRESRAPVSLSINDVLDSVIDLLKSKINNKQAKVHKQYDAIVQIIGVPGELRQIFSNLLTNSLDAIFPGGNISVSIGRVEQTQAGRRITVTVVDDGVGIRPELLSHIFEPFFTTKKAVGTGLGLWVGKQLLEKHGGAISVQSAITGEHRGTTISVVLPVEGGAFSKPDADQLTFVKASMAD